MWDLPRVVSRGVTGWGWALFIVGTMLPLRFIYPRRHRRRRGCCYLESKNQCGCTHIAGSVDDRSKATTTAMVAEWIWNRKAVWWLRFHIWLCVPFDLSLKACMLFACQKKKRRDWMNNSLEQPKGECLVAWFRQGGSCATALINQRKSITKYRLHLRVIWLFSQLKYSS